MLILSHHAPRNRAFLACDHRSTVVLRDLHPVIRQAGRSRRVFATGSLAPGDLPRRSLNLPGATRLTLDGDAAAWAKQRPYRERLTEALDCVGDSAAKLGVTCPLLTILVSLDAAELPDVCEALTDVHNRRPDCTLLPLVVAAGPDATPELINQNAARIEALHQDQIIPVALLFNPASREGVGPLVHQRAEQSSLLHFLFHQAIPAVEASLQPSPPTLLADLGRRGPWATLQVAIATVPEGPVHPVIRFIRALLRRLMALFPARAWSGREVFRALPPRWWGGHLAAEMTTRALASAESVGLCSAAGSPRPGFIALPLAPRDRRWSPVSEVLTDRLADQAAGPVTLVSGNGVATIRSREPYLIQVTAFESHQTLPDLSQLGATVHLAAPIDHDSVTVNGHQPATAMQRA